MHICAIRRGSALYSYQKGLGLGLGLGFYCSMAYGTVRGLGVVA